MDKSGGDIPRDIFLEKNLQKFILSIINSKEFKNRKYWNWKIVNKMFIDTVNGKKDWSSELWRIIFLELWFRIWIENSINRP